MSERAEVFVGHSILSAHFFHKVWAFSFSAWTLSLALDLDSCAIGQTLVVVCLSIGATDWSQDLGALTDFRLRHLY